MFKAMFSILISTLVLITAQPSQLLAQKRILVLSWNVESGDNDPATIAQQIEDFEGYDIIGLTEVKLDNATDYADAASAGEGAKGSSQADFRHAISRSGGGDRMMIAWDNRRFELIGDTQELNDLNDGNHRSPQFAQFKLGNTDVEFLFMVNHLARSNGALREQQATGLKEWAEKQQLPVIAVGDYNFDYDIDEGEGNQAMRNMLEGNVWQWVRPQRLNKTQASGKFNSVLDFIFIANMPDTWKLDSSIITVGFPSDDDNLRSDHRPLEGRILIFD